MIDCNECKYGKPVTIDELNEIVGDSCEITGASGVYQCELQDVTFIDGVCQQAERKAVVQNEIRRGNTVREG